MRSADGFFSRWSAPTVVNAIAPFDLASVKFPDDKGPSYKLKAQIREHSARGKVTIYLAKGKKKGKFHQLGKAKINKKGRFTKRFTVRHTAPTGCATSTGAPASWPPAA